jgi:hypothetical protein
MTKGHLEKSAIERLPSQARADAGMNLNCCIPLELESSRYLKIRLLIPKNHFSDHGFHYQGLSRSHSGDF